MVTSLFSRHFNSQQESSETGPQEMVTNSPRGHIEMSVFTFIFNFVLHDGMETNYCHAYVQLCRVITYLFLLCHE